MKLNRVTALFLGLVLAFSLAACGQGASSASTASSSASSAAAEGKTEEQLLTYILDRRETLTGSGIIIFHSFGLEHIPQFRVSRVTGMISSVRHQ